MRTAIIMTVAALTFGAGACAAPRGAEFTKGDAEAIRKTTLDLIAAVNAKDVEKVLGVYAETSVFMPPNAPLMRGRDPLREYYAGMFSRGAKLEMEADEIAGHGPIGYDSGSYTIHYADGSRDRGKYLRLLRSMNGTWRVEKTIWSSDLPQTAAAAN